MEEGPEPQELIERTVEHHHHEHEHAHEPEGNRGLMVSAITAAVLAVLAAIGSLLSGHAANQAILCQTQATDKWAYFQSKSTKGHIHEADGRVVAALARLQGVSKEKYEAELAEFQQEAKRQREEKVPIQKEARSLEAQAAHEFHKHHNYSLGIAAFQVGIVLASISILVRQRVLYWLSLAAGAVGIAFLLLGVFTPEHGAEEHQAEEACVSRRC